MTEDDAWLSWGEQYLARYAIDNRVTWAYLGNAIIGDGAWSYFTAARMAEADGSPEGAWVQALVESGAIPFRERYQARHVI